MTDYAVTYEQADDGSWSVHADGLPVFSVGDTLEEAEAGIREAIALHLEGLATDGDLPPAPRTVNGTVTV